MHIAKTWVWELREIIRKRHIWGKISWSKSQQREFDEYWRLHYGRTIPNWWHRLYQAFNGEFRVDYVPEAFYSTKIEPRLVDYGYARVFEDKFFSPWILPYIADSSVVSPCIYLARSKGTYYGVDHRPMSMGAALRQALNIGASVLKPSTGSSSGKSISMLDIRQGKDINSGRPLEEIIASTKGDFLIQECIIPHASFAKLHPSSINTIRVITYIYEGELHHAPLSMRIGVGDSRFDNIHSGGISVGVSDSGCLQPTGYRLGYTDCLDSYNAHPDTGVVFAQCKLPCIPEMVSAAEQLHRGLPHVGIASWDLTCDKNGRIVLVEVNLRGQSIWFPQILNKVSIFGADTSKFVKLAAIKLFREE